MSFSDSEATLAEVRRKLRLSNDELMAELGQSLGKGATFTDALKRGRTVLENISRELRGRICSNSEVIRCYKASKGDEVTVIATIVDAVAGSLHGVAPATVAILLFRMGLTNYCGSGWPENVG
jgi:hypothetical protein